MKVIRHLLGLLMMASIVMQPLRANEPNDQATLRKGWASKKKPAVNTISTTVAEWSVLVYIAADNSLASFASYNINDMMAGMASTRGINLLVQWDQPRNFKTWRYNILPGKKLDAGSFASEMGYNPANELVASMQWVKKVFPAKRYAIGLWNHGSGIEDFSPGVRDPKKNPLRYPTWLPLPGYSPMKAKKGKQRGILYDDSQGTCLTNQGLTSALAQIKQIIGKKIDVVFMDACLMGMAEVAYQIRDSVNLLVSSQETIPGTGFPYSKFIRPLSSNPVGTSALQLAQSMITGYQQFYTVQQPTSDFTLSTIDVTSIGLIKQNIDQFIAAVSACNQLNSSITKNMIVAARQAAISFEMPEYIDLQSFYSGILSQAKRTSPKSNLILGKQNNNRARITAPTQAYQDALDALVAVIQDGITKISTVVVQNTTGAVYSGARGISVYYPNFGGIDRSYPLTLFAQDTSWVDFIQYYQ